GAAVQVIGELEVFQALDAPPLLLRARIARCVDGLDMNLYEQCLEVRRQFESEFCPQDEASNASEAGTTVVEENTLPCGWIVRNHTRGPNDKKAGTTYKTWKSPVARMYNQAVRLHALDDNNNSNSNP
ncbi:unnamed protein product, partial [Polarella glacialis]